MNGIDADTLLREAVCVIPHQADHAMFGRGVPGTAMAHGTEPNAAGLQPSRRAGDDDRASPGVVQQRRKRSLDGEVHAVEHDVHGIEVGGHLVRLLTEDRHDPGVGENEIQPAELSHAVGDDGLESLEIADVGLLGDDATTGLLHEIDGLVEILAGGHRIGHTVDLLAEVDCDDVGALLGEPHRVGPALTACRAGDEGDSSIKSIAHGQVSLSIFSCGIEQQGG
jgi:hypothetical protein